MGNLFYFICEAFRGFYQAKLMTFVSILTIAATMLLISGMTLGLVNIDEFLRRSQDQADVAVYLYDNVAENVELRKLLFDSLNSMAQIKHVEFVSKDNAWERFKAIHGEEILEAVDENPFPASFDLILESGADADELQNALMQIDGIESMQYSREWLDFVRRLRHNFLLISGIMAVIITLALHAMISNTIKLTIYARKELVSNMRYVGATDFFIKMPFILEGMLQGLIGGLICISVLYTVKFVFSHIPVYWGTEFVPLLILTIGVFFGWLGSVSAVRKFLV